MIEEIKKIIINNIEEKGENEGKDRWIIKDEIREVEQAKKLETLGLNITEAIQLLQENNIPVMLKDEDKETIIDSSRVLKDKKDFVCVHKTNYIPKGDRIRTGKESGVVFDEKIKIDEKEYEIQYEQERDTVHFCVNGEVAANNGGTWDDCKYAIIVPLESIDATQIKGAVPVDLYTKGGVELKEDSWIICPRGESNKIKEQNKKINIIEYDGENVSEYANVLLQYLGYDYKEGNNVGWTSEMESQENFYNILEKEGVPSLSLRTLHADSFSGQTENDKDTLNIDKEKIRILKKQNKLNTIEDVNKLLDNIPIPGGGAWGHVPTKRRNNSVYARNVRIFKRKENKHTKFT